jgi:ribosomal protein S6--L-glutamate ligase
VKEGLIPVTPALKKLALNAGKLFGLDIFGLDVVETPQGLAILDINDFPSFGLVPRAVARISEYILHAAKRAEMEREARIERQRRRRQARHLSLQATKPTELGSYDLAIRPGAR